MKSLFNESDSSEIIDRIGLSKDPHPFFGNLNSEEWDTLNWKHLDHHLRQFGV